MKRICLACDGERLIDGNYCRICNGEGVVERAPSEYEKRHGHKRYIGDDKALHGRGALVRPGPADNIALAQFDFANGHKGGPGDELQDPRCFGWHEVPIEDFEEFSE